jgi:serine/threonine protein kinase
MEKDPAPAPTGIAHDRGPSPDLERYGRYSLIEQIGRGGMAEVFRAVAQGVEGFRRVFVIKRLRPEKSASTELVRMFCDEARLSALLHHPNIVQVYDFGQINGTYFLAMEYLRGKDLSAVMKALRRAKGAVSPPLAARIAHQVATGLHYAHTLTRPDGKTLRVVHRDVTPSNVMLQRTGVVKILDFGIAQATNFARQVETGGGRVKGKLAYLSPEQVRLEELDGRSDVFALGVVLWEMLTGQRLFAAENEFLTMRGVLIQPVPPPSSKRPEVPPALDAIVARALQRERDSRYPDAQEMADDLERFLQEAPCHSQALARLLQDLFGEESTDHTPDLPDFAAAEAGEGSTSAPSTPVPVPSAAGPVLEIDAEVPPPSAQAALASVGAAPSAPFVDRRATARRLVAGAALATLVACFSWALWRGKHPAAAPRSAATSVARAGTGAVVVVSAPAGGTEESAEPPVAVPTPAEPDSDKGAASASPSSSPRVAKKRPPRRLSNDVTLDPFK